MMPSPHTTASSRYKTHQGRPAQYLPGGLLFIEVDSTQPLRQKNGAKNLKTYILNTRWRD
jgi:hypothetical protein